MDSNHTGAKSPEAGAPVAVHVNLRFRAFISG